MIAAFRTELYKITRPRLVAGLVAVAVVLAVGMVLVVFLSASEQPGAAGDRTATRAALAEPGGATEAFALGVSFSGILVFLMFIMLFAGEFSLGTIRMLLMQQPHRLSLLAGKMAALLACVAAFLLLTQALVWVAATVVAPTQDVGRDAWFTLEGVGQAARNYGLAIVVVAAWALFGASVALIFRSVPIAVAVGFFWAGPLEHVLQDRWQGVTGYFPGLLLETMAVGGTSDVSYERGLVLVTGYVAIAVAVSALLFVRRDVTS